jgi:muramidase (phage lysozyme)
MESTLTRDEIRELFGYEPLEQDEVVVEVVEDTDIDVDIEKNIDKEDE